MKKLYDEIMELNYTSNYCDDYYKVGFEEGIEAASELAKKYDDEIDILKIEIIGLSLQLLENK